MIVALALSQMRAAEAQSPGYGVRIVSLGLDRAVEGKVGQLVRALVLGAWHRLDVERLELPAQFQQAGEERLKARIAHLVPELKLSDDELRVHAQADVTRPQRE